MRLAHAGMGGGEGGQATALVVDAEVTSYLMMGALSPGLKRHSVTLFEGSPSCSSSHQSAPADSSLSTLNLCGCSQKCV